MSRGRSIELFFVDGTADGIVTATIPFQWSGHVLVTRRTQIKEALARDETLRPGIYLLIGDQEGEPTVYIGETDELRTRTEQHLKTKDWWETAVLISSSGEPLNKAHARYLEFKIYKITESIGKISIANLQSPTESKLSDAAKAHMDGFLENILLVLPALRFDFVAKNTKPQASMATQESPAQTYFTFEVAKNGIKAKAYIDDGDFVVEAGSLARLKWEGAIHQTYVALHEELIKQGVLQPQGDLCVFTQSYGFSSASAAAAVAAGRPASGPKSWVVEGTGQNYGTWEASRLGQAIELEAASL